MPRSVQLVLGPPGTGKTTRLLQLVKEELDRGVPPERIGFVSFSRRALTEAKDRVAKAVGATLEFPYFRTIHATAFALLELSRNQVLQNEHLQTFADHIGIPISQKSPGFREEGSLFATASWDGTIADQALAVYAKARARGVTPREEWRAAALLDLTWDRFDYVVSNYERFKEYNGLTDFSDMIEQAQGELPIDVLFVDEAQDTSMAQWALLRRITPAGCRIIIAGDDDQCVYGWSGASSEMLLRLQGDVTVLPQSHRLPRRVKAVADMVLGRIRQRVPKEFAPRDAEGSVGWIGGPDRVNLTDGRSHLLIARSNYQLRQWRAIARKQGVIYTLPNGEWSWSLDSVRAAYAWEALRKGQKVTRTELSKVNKFLDHKLDLTRDAHQWGDFFPEDAPGRDLPWLKALVHMPPEDREYIRLIRRRGESLKEPGRVRIGTIHSVKGAEADHVAMMTDISDRVERASRVDPDAEYRVLYVGITRAREQLSLVQPQSRRAYRL